MLKWITNLFKGKQSKTFAEKEFEELLKTHNTVYSIYEKGVLIASYENINKLAKKHKLIPSTIYSAIKKKGTYKIHEYEIIKYVKNTNC